MRNNSTGNAHKRQLVSLLRTIECQTLDPTTLDHHLSEFEERLLLKTRQDDRERFLEQTRRARIRGVKRAA